MLPHRIPSQPNRPPAFLVVLSVALIAAVTAFASPVRAQELRFTTQNDILADNPTPDDLYTFAVALEVERGAYTFSLRENAFTDRAAEVRFDETYLSIGRALSGTRPWRLSAEVGAVHVGHGLFGEDVQNAVHRLIGDDEVDLPYGRSSLHPRLALAAERSWALADRLEVGPLLHLDAVPGLRSYALLGAAARWQPTAGVALHLMLGGRWSHASFAPLEPHLDGLAAAARVEVVLQERLVLSWSSNDYGDEREHLSLGYRLAGGGGRRPAGGR